MARKPRFDNIDTSPLLQLEKKLNSLSQFLEVKEQLYRRVCERLTPFVRSIMLQSLQASGIHRRTGNLEHMVASTVVYPTRKGIRIALGPGFSADDYAKAGALQYGSIHNSGVSSAKTRRTLKNAGVEGSRAAHSYFTLSASQISEIGEKFNSLLQDEFNRMLKS
jgi:phage gpG-like protein